MLCLWSAASVYAKYAKLWELTREASGRDGGGGPPR